MSKPYDSIRLVISGTIAGVQSWSCGITVAPTATGQFSPEPNQAILDTWVQNRVVNVRDMFTLAGTRNTTLKSLMGSSTQVDGLDAYFYPSGSDISTVQSTANFGAAIVGTSTVQLPAQAAVVASLRSGQPGRRGRGRLYLPLTGATIDNTLHLQTLPMQDVAQRVAQLLTDIGNSQVGGLDVDAVVGSTFGAYVITSVVVDNDIDTQRRRSDKIVATQRPVQAVPIV